MPATTKTNRQLFVNGLLNENPIFRLALSMCPAVGIPTYTLTIATWVTVIDLVLAAYVPVAYAAMGIFVRLIVAFAIITMRLEVFACKNDLVPSFWDGMGMGLGFMFGMVVLGAIREILGMGTLLGYNVLGFRPMLFFVLPAAGFFTVGFMMAIFNYVEARYNRVQKEEKAI